MKGPWRALLRMAAVAIAIGGTVDPALVRARVPAIELALVVAVAPAQAADAEAAVASLARAIGSRARLDRRGLSGEAAPCGPAGACVVVADGSRHVEVARDRRGPASLLLVPAPERTGTAVVAVDAGARQHPAARGTAQVRIEGRGLTGQTSTVRVIDAGIEVGRVEHRWREDGQVEVAVPWWPVADGPRVLRVEVAAADGERNVDDNSAETGVLVTPARTRVLVFEPRLAWASTFVRRALARDPRLQVEGHARVAPGVAVSTPGARLDAARLQGVSVVVAGGLDQLTPEEAALLDRFVRVRGGTLVLLPDRRPSAAAARLFRGGWTERLSRTATPVGPLKATEILRLAASGPADRVLARDGDAPVVVLMPSGRGRILVSGAMDAWRFRAEAGGAFGRFWRSLVAELGPHGDALSVETAALVAAGTRTPVRVRWRPIDEAGAVRAGATVSCGAADPEPIRLWPSGEPGLFEGAWIAGPRADACVVTATVDGHRAEASAVVTGRLRPGRAAALAEVEAAARASGGVVVSAGDEAHLASSLLQSTPAAPVPASAHPFRSPWWMVPFAACLGGEWWLRRRAGLR